MKRVSQVNKHQGNQNANKPSAHKQRTPEEIKADIASSRENLTNTIGELQVAVKQATDPKNIAMKIGAKIKGIYVSPDGQVNVKNVGITVGVVVGVVVLRKITHRKSAPQVQIVQKEVPTQK